MPQRGWRILLVVWMGLIFLVSSSLLVDAASFDATEAVFGGLNYVFRKMAHVAEYGILAYLWFRSLWTRRDGFRKAVAWSLLLSAIYAITDEAHQSTVPGRLGKPSDVLFDTLGSLSTAALLMVAMKLEGGSLRRRLLGPLGDTEV